MLTKTYTTEAGAKKAAAGGYSPAVVRLANGRYAWIPYAGSPLPRSAHTVSRWSANRWQTCNN
jgi:hypothetical protein